MIDKKYKLKRRGFVGSSADASAVSFILFLIVLIFALPCSAKTTEEALKSLKSLPYVSHTSQETDEQNNGVIKYRPDKCYNSYNFFQVYTDKFYLMDMFGNIVHTWSMPNKTQVEYGVLLDNGDVMVVGLNTFARLSWDSKIKFDLKGHYHHDVEVLDDGSYLVLNFETKPYNGYEKVVFDYLEHISRTGERLYKWSTYEHLPELKKYHRLSALEERAKSLTRTEYDYYHLNTIKTLPENELGKKDKRFQKGNWLLCSRHTNLVFILDKDTREVVWSWGPGELDWPHYPVTLDNGDILIFDNGKSRGYSRVIQVNPLTNKVVWEYKEDPPKKFYSSIRGCSQKLANDNILITESEKGRVFEITRQGKIVWDYYCPQKDEKGRRLAIYRMIRYPKGMIDRLLKDKDKE